jgi:hypothetical protein
MAGVVVVVDVPDTTGIVAVARGMNGLWQNAVTLTVPTLVAVKVRLKGLDVKGD